METYIPNKIAVVILCWNNKHFLELFLPSIILYSQEAKIFLIDNASTDDSVKYVEHNFPEIEIIQHEQNLGFCLGYNKAVQYIHSEYLVLLNSDVEVTQNWLQPIISFMDSNTNAAVCQPKIMAYENKGIFEYAGAAGGFLDKYGYPFCRGRIFDTLERDNGQYDHILPISWGSGACFFIRTELFKSYGGFDEDFFAHMEEIDLCWRLTNAGYDILFIPESTVYHVGGGTLNKSSDFKTFLNFRNGLYLLHKNLPKNLLFNRIFTRLLLDGVAAISFLLKRDLKQFFAVLKAHFAYYNALKKLNNKRRLQENKADNNLKYYSIVSKYFIQKKKLYTDLPL